MTEELTHKVLDSTMSWNSWDWMSIKRELAEAKSCALDSHNEADAKSFWVLETAGEAASQYIQAFGLLKAGRYYDGWCLLERSETNASFALRHATDERIVEMLRIVAEQVFTFQGAFPYRVFFSPGYVIREAKCSICGARTGPRARCGHKRGEIYGGKMCCRIITKSEVLEVSIVDKPAQKYSVGFAGPGGTDHHDYSVVEFIAERVVSPFHTWKLRKETRFHAHDDFGRVPRDELCPCGATDLLYGDCCGPKPGVEMPHFQVSFSVPPPEGVSMFEYGGAARRRT